MKKTAQSPEKPGGPGVSRRTFLRNATVAAGAIGAMGTIGLAGCAPQKSSDANGTETDGEGTFASDARLTASADGLAPDTSTDITYLPRRGEYPTPAVEAPATTEYACDVLVVGGGLSGLNAAYAAAQAGKSVILAEKGTPGYCGLSAWPSCTAYYDPELDADMDTWDQYMRNSCDCFANLNWEDAWCQESKEAFDRLRQWGWIQSYDRAADTEYWVDGNIYHDDLKGYKNSVPDRREVFCKVLDENGVTTLDHIMITDIVEKDGACIGAVGLLMNTTTSPLSGFALRRRQSTTTEKVHRHRRDAKLARHRRISRKFGDPQTDVDNAEIDEQHHERRRAPRKLTQRRQAEYMRRGRGTRRQDRAHRGANRACEKEGGVEREAPADEDQNELRRRERYGDPEHRPAAVAAREPASPQQHERGFERRDERHGCHDQNAR